MTDTLDAPVFEESILPMCGTPRSTAIAAGDLNRATLREVDRVLALHPKDTLASLEVAVARLVSDGAIPRCDVPRLEAILRAVVGANTDGSVEPASAVIRRIYDELIMDPAAGTITIAIASVATGAAEAPRPTNGSAPAAANQGGDVGLVAGAIVGAVIGFGIGGFVGGGIGATVGGIAGAIAGKCAS